MFEPVTLLIAGLSLVLSPAFSAALNFAVDQIFNRLFGV